MNDDRVGELFNDDWRDPGDDLERAGYLVAYAVFTLVGLALIVGSVVGALAARGAGGAIVLLLLGGGMGTFMALVSSAFLRREAQRVDWRTMTADRMVAGGLLAGLATSGLGLFMLRAAGRSRHSAESETLLVFGLFAFGLVILLGSLVIGLALAFGGGRTTNREFHVKTVLARYALAPGGECAQEHPNPEEDGLQGWITFRGNDGRKYDFRATPQTYADAYVAAGGRLRVERGVVVSIQPYRQNRSV